MLRPLSWQLRSMPQQPEATARRHRLQGQAGLGLGWQTHIPSLPSLAQTASNTGALFQSRLLHILSIKNTRRSCYDHVIREKDMTCHMHKKLAIAACACSAQMDPTFRCETAFGETSHTAKSWAIASGPVGYVDRMPDKMGTMLYSLTLK